MEGRYKVTFEIDMFDDQKRTLEHYLSEVINTMFDMSPKNLKVEKILSESDLKRWKHTIGDKVK